MKLVQYSDYGDHWCTIGEWQDAEADFKWAAFQSWIDDEQVYGFFRLVDDGSVAERFKAPVSNTGGRG